MTPAHVKALSVSLKVASTVFTVAAAIVGNEVCKNNVIGIVAKAHDIICK